MRVENIVSNNGNNIANQFIIRGDGVITFQSYQSEIITLDSDLKIIFVGDDYDYSVTTGKYRNIFFRDYAPYELRDLQNLDTLRKAIKEEKFGLWQVVRKSL